MTPLERARCELSIRRQEYDFIKRDICRQETYKDYSKTRAQLAAAVSSLKKVIEGLGGIMIHLTPTEQWILQILWDGEATSREIWEEISGGTSQPKINGHMSNLRRLGLIRSFRRDSINLIALTPLGVQCCLSIYERRLEDWRPS